MTNPGVDRAGLATSTQASESAQQPGPGMRDCSGLAGLPFQLAVGIGVMTPQMLSLPVLCPGKGENIGQPPQTCFLGAFSARLYQTGPRDLPQRFCLDS